MDCIYTTVLASLILYVNDILIIHVKYKILIIMTCEAMDLEY